MTIWEKAARKFKIKWRVLNDKPFVIPTTKHENFEMCRFPGISKIDRRKEEIVYLCNVIAFLSVAESVCYQRFSLKPACLTHHVHSNCLFEHKN